MNTFLFIIKTIYKKKWLVLIVPIIVSIIVYLFLASKPDKFKSSTTVYTGIISGYDASSGKSSVQDWMAVDNAIENLINIIKSETTLETVSLRLLARNLSHCDETRDNEYMTQESAIDLLMTTPIDVLALVVDGDEDQTYKNLRAYFDKDNSNYLKRLFNWEHRHYSFKALSSMEISRIGYSDMLKITYTNDDPYIVYNTLLLVEAEFVKQYTMIRFEQTNDVVAYFERELKIIGDELRRKEDILTEYNIEKGIINYQEQTRMVAERSRDLDGVIDDVTREYEGAKQRIMVLEEKMGHTTELFRSNTEFVNQLNRLSNLYNENSQLEADGRATEEVSRKISNETDKLRDISSVMAGLHYSKEGLANDAMITQWLDALLTQVRTEQELKVLRQSRREVENDISRFSPVGSSIKRQDREINFSEQSYLSNLQGLNEAKLRQKNLQLTSATFRTITPPTVAVKPEKTKNTLYAVITFIFTLIIMMVFVVVSELFNKLPYDKQAARKLIGLPVLGAVPDNNANEKIEAVARALAANQLGNAIVNYFDRTKDVNIINVISLNSDDGKSTLCESLMQHFEKIDTKPVLISYEKDFDVENKYYLMAGSIYDFGVNENNFDKLPEANVIIVEYPPMANAAFPIKLLNSASVTLLVADVHKVWKDMNHIVVRQLMMNDKDHKLATVLNRADNDCVGTFTGMLPPYTLRHKIHFAMWNLGNVTFDEEYRG